MAQPFNLSHEKMPLAVELREATAANIALRKRIAKHDAAATEKGETPMSKTALGKLSFGLGFADSVAHIPPAQQAGSRQKTSHTTGHTANDSAQFL
jgi:hypothetical protein